MSLGASAAIVARLPAGVVVSTLTARFYDLPQGVADALQAHVAAERVSFRQKYGHKLPALETFLCEQEWLAKRGYAAAARLAGECADEAAFAAPEEV